MTKIRLNGLWALAAALGANSMPAMAQVTAPWETFFDDVSTSACDVVNASNVELVVLHATGELAVVTGIDATLSGTEVDGAGNVFFDGAPAGFITFAEDGDGLRSLWWISLTGRVIELDGLSGEPIESDSFPDDFRGAGCDACDFWDDQTICADPPVEEPDVVISFCADGIVLPMFMMIGCLSAVRLVRSPRRRWSA